MRTEGNGQRNRRTVKRTVRVERQSPSWGLRVDNIIPVSLCVLLIVYLAFYFVDYLNREEPQVVPVVYGSVDVPLVHKGVIVRDEVVYTNFRDGVVFFLVNDKARVRKDTVVCEVYDEETVRDIEYKLSAVNANILSEQGRGARNPEYDEEIAAADEIIRNEINAEISDISPYNLRSMYQLHKRLQQTLDVRNNLLLAGGNTVMTGSSQERAKYLGQLEQAKSVIATGKSGIISYAVDGLEETLSVSKRADIEKETILTGDQGLFTGETAALSDAGAFKLIASNEWYVVSYIENEIADTLAEGRDATLYLVEGDSYEPLEMSVESIESGETESYVIFKSDRKMLDYLDRRTLSFKINLDVTQGYKIPNSAIAERTLLRIPNSFIDEQRLRQIGDPSKCVVKLTGDGERLVEINALRADDVYSYVLQEESGLMMNDTISSAEGQSLTISDFETVKGVYIMNAGIRTFCVINISGEVSGNSNYTVIDPKLNEGLNLDDLILLDVSGDLT